MPIDAQRWQRLSPWLDQLLAQPEPEREAWLAELGRRDAELEAELRALWVGPPREADTGWLEQSASDLAASVSAVPLASAALAGQRIGAYTLVAPLGEGGMGAVWLAERSDGRFQARAAVKLLHGGLVQRTVAARFRREGAVLARLSHPHIARLIDAGLTDDGQPYLVLEHVAGERIDRWCDARKLDLRARVALFDQVLQAVQHAHVQLVVHRDLKPGNVLVDGEGHVKLLDFGIAKLLDADDALAEATELTRDGIRVLTPQYAAPEQTQGDAITTATDVFALGLLLFVLLTGQHPRVDAKCRHTMSVGELPGASQVVTDTGRRSLLELNASAEARGTTPARLSHALAGDLDNILAKALRLEPAERYGTVAALAEDLRRHLDGQTVSARPDSLAYRASRFVVRHKLGVGLATAALATIIGTAVLADQQRRAAVRERDLTAQQQASTEAVAVFMEELLGQVGEAGRGLDPAALLDHAERRAQQLFYDQPDVLARLHHHFLVVNFYLGREDHVVLNVQAIASAASAIDDPVARAEAACNGTLRTENIPAALATIDQALASLPDVPRSRSVRWACGFERGEVLDIAGRFEEAAAAFEAARRAAPPLYDRLRAISNTKARAEVLASLGQLAAADEAMVQATRLYEEAGRGRSLAMVNQLLRRSGLQSTMGRPRESLALIGQARELARGTERAAGLAPAIELRTAFELLQLGRDDEARRTYESVLMHDGQLQPLYPRYWGAVGLTHQLRGEADQAVQVLERSIAANKSAGYRAYESLELVVLARVLLMQRQPERALAVLDSLGTAEDATHRLEALLFRARALNMAGRAIDAERAAREAVNGAGNSMPAGIRSSKHGYAHLELAEALAAQGRPLEARAAAERAATEFNDTLGSDHSATRTALALAGQGAR